MGSNRRRFIRNITLGMGTLATGVSAIAETKENSLEIIPVSGSQQFNMCGYAAPKLDKVRIGFVGLGNARPRRG